MHSLTVLQHTLRKQHNIYCETAVHKIYQGVLQIPLPVGKDPASWQNLLYHIYPNCVVPPLESFTPEVVQKLLPTTHKYKNMRIEE